MTAKNKKTNYSISVDLDTIRKTIEKHLKQAEKELGANIEMGGIRYSLDSKGNLANFSSKLEYCKQGQSKEMVALEKIMKILITDKLVDEDIDITQTFDYLGRKIKFTGWRNKAPKRPVMFLENGKEYITTASMLGSVLGIERKDMEDHHLFWQDFPKVGKLNIHEL
tara:strand:+ start:110 stop:610 length:501 start_codon:yes stop_codon:yes gene_type:complete